VSEVRAVFSWSYTALAPPAARLFRRLGLHPGPDISASAAASLGSHALPEVRARLTELAAPTLLTEHASGWYTFHDLLRAYATDLTQPVDTPTSAAPRPAGCSTTTPTPPTGCCTRIATRSPFPSPARTRRHARAPRRRPRGNGLADRAAPRFCSPSSGRPRTAGSTPTAGS
jgi:hypothetical protein